MTTSFVLDLQAEAARPALGRIARDIRPHWRPLLVGSIAAIVVAVASAAGPLLVGWTIDKGVIGEDLQSVRTGTFAFAFASVVSLLAMRLQVRAMGRFANA
ncbi:MAG: ABC-type multidrug transport system fused ATPase/permease subunit, partial [Glaciecola sp.]